jgi:Domain of unknown function (DUF4826)
MDETDDEEQWCQSQRCTVAEYLRSQNVTHGRIGEWPAWHVAPYVSIWAIESHARPEWIGWWVVAGNLPTDYISASEIEPPQHPRKAIKALAERWLRMLEAWSEGRDYQGIRIAHQHSNNELALLLDSRAQLLIGWAQDDALWGED